MLRNILLAHHLKNKTIICHIVVICSSVSNVNNTVAFSKVTPFLLSLSRSYMEASIILLSSTFMYYKGEAWEQG